jgi:hypothetical protein
MRAVRLVVAALLVIVGVIWFGQGVGWIGGSFMTGAAVWAVIGGVCVVAGVAVALSSRGVRPRS